MVRIESSPISDSATVGIVNYCGSPELSSLVVFIYWMGHGLKVERGSKRRLKGAKLRLSGNGFPDVRVVYSHVGE